MKKEIMKKRFLTIALAGVCSIGLLTACGGENRNTSGTEKVNKTVEKSIEKTTGIQASDPGAFIEQLYQVYMIEKSEDEFTSNIRQNAFTYDFRNNSDRLVYLSAWASTPTVKMTTEDGSEYTCPFDSMVSVQPGNSDTETLYFAGAKGTPKTLLWDTITYCSESNLPDGTISFTVNME